MHEHRLAKSTLQEFYSFDSQFSIFRFLCGKIHYNIPAIHRCFSLARSISCLEKSIVWEQLDPIGEGIILEENNAIKAVYPDYFCKSLIRVSFWRARKEDVQNLQVSSKDLIGYCIIKHDVSQSANLNRAHVFEAVFPKYDHPHNCSHDERLYQIRVGKSLYNAKGVIFCQQNSIFKCCAHVALFSVLSLYERDKEISFAKMNEIAGIIPPDTGLNTESIRKILRYYEIDFYDIDYDQASKEDSNAKDQFPFQRLAYAGIESGGGALVGFSLERLSNDPPARHMIPFFGHTFNKDTWVPHADISYFHISSALTYIPSDSWTSSFIGHDDNFGANFCIPKLYIQKENVNYVVEIFRPGVKYSALVAEAFAVQFLYSVIDNCTGFNNFWITQLIDAKKYKNITVRAVALQKEEYFASLSKNAGPNDNKIMTFLQNAWPEFVWVAEISLPQLFSANEEKLGEIILDATQSKPDSSRCFLAARLPSLWFLLRVKNGKHSCFYLPSDIEGHIENYTAFSPIETESHEIQV